MTFDLAQNNQMLGALSILHYLHNTSAVQFAEDIFPDGVRTYKNEKAIAFAEAPTRAIGNLDSRNLQKLLLLAMERHGAAAEQQMRSWKS
jgi:hypothetical protein